MILAPVVGVDEDILLPLDPFRELVKKACDSDTPYDYECRRA